MNLPNGNLLNLRLWLPLSEHRWVSNRAARLIALGTRPSDESHWFAQMLSGGADYAQTHAAKPEAPKFQTAYMAQGLTLACPKCRTWNAPYAVESGQGEDGPGNPG